MAWELLCIHHSPQDRQALHCTALHCTALHCTALHCTALHCTALMVLTVTSSEQDCDHPAGRSDAEERQKYASAKAETQPALHSAPHTAHRSQIKTWQSWGFILNPFVTPETTINREYICVSYKQQNNWNSAGSWWDWAVGQAASRMYSTCVFRICWKMFPRNNLNFP
jgi:hypothetical protein